MTLTEKFLYVSTMLSKIADPYHYWTQAERSNRYIIWSENAESDPVNGDNHKQEQVIPFNIDLYVLDDMDAAIDKMQEVLDQEGLSWQYDGSTFEQETGLIHHMWRIEV